MIQPISFQVFRHEDLSPREWSRMIKFVITVILLIVFEGGYFLTKIRYCSVKAELLEFYATAP